MRLLTYRTAGGPAAAIQVDETLVPAGAVDAPSTVRGLLEGLDGEGLRELAARAEDAEERIPLAEATLHADPRRAQDHLHGPQLPRSRGGDGSRDPGRSDVVRQVRQLAYRQRPADRAARFARRVRRLRG